MGTVFAIAVPVAHAAVPDTATVTLDNSTDLPATMEINAAAAGLYPETPITYEQCATKQSVVVECDVLYNESSTADDGTNNEDVDVAYQMTGGATCDSVPDSTTTTCYVEVIYAGGNYAGTVAATAPLSFAGHDGGSTPGTAALTVTPPGGPAPLAVVADASGSTAGSAAIVGYSFDWGDGSTTPEQSKPSAPHTFVTPNTTDTVVVTVHYADQTTLTAQQNVQVGASGSSVDCAPNTTCTITATSPATGQSATVTALGGAGTPDAVITASFGGNVAPLHGCSTTAPGILTFDGNRQKIIKLTIATGPLILKFCYGQPTPFTDITLRKTTFFSASNNEYEGILGSLPGPLDSPAVHLGAHQVADVGDGDGHRRSERPEAQPLAPHLSERHVAPAMPRSDWSRACVDGYALN